MYSVYKHTCPNNKVYIGITCLDVNERWRHDGKGYKKQYFYRAIQKYGWANIKHEIILENLTREQAEQIERDLIAQYESNKPERGYNIDNGGKCGCRMNESTKEKLRQINTGKHHKEESIRKMSECRIGIKLSESHKAHISEGNKGKRLTDEVKRKLSEARKGTHLSDETKHKLSETNSGASNPNARKILLVDEEGNCIKEFATSQDAQKELHISKNSITAVLKGRQKQSKGYIFRYA